MRLMMILGLAALAASPPALAGSWTDENGYGWHRVEGEWQEEYDDGTCRVERKMKRNGAYKEEVVCEAPPWAEDSLAPPMVVVQDWAPPAAALPRPRPPHDGDVYQDDAGRHCREYRTTATIEGRREALHGTVCRQPDGSWSFSD